MSLLRFKCPSCGTVSDLPINSICPKCKQPIPVPGMGCVQIYRMGSPIGMAVGFAIYINGEPYGHIANKESIRIPLAYGTYSFHFACGMNRKCQDLTVILTPEEPAAYMKVHMKAGFWSNTFIPELSTFEEMPPIN